MLLLINNLTKYKESSKNNSKLKLHSLRNEEVYLQEG